MANAYAYYFRPQNVTQTRAVASTAAAAAAVSDTCSAVSLNSTVDCYVNFGGTASATAGCYLKAGLDYTFTIHPSEVISAIRVSGDGTLYISELTR